MVVAKVEKEGSDGRAQCRRWSSGGQIVRERENEVPAGKYSSGEIERKKIFLGSSKSDLHPFCILLSGNLL